MGEQDGSDVRLRFEGFAWEAIKEESARLGVPLNELIVFAVMYYLADVDAGRIARRPLSAPLRHLPRRALSRIRRRR